jgi:16S rRNA (cytosine1402-N4)-methyltransferase
VNTYDEAELARIIAEYGEEHFARQIAARIVAARPVETTGELVEIIKEAIPAPARRKGPHPARRTFQALRMEVNRELEHLDACLDESVHLLAPGGRMAVIAYHSLEDRIVKEHFAEWSRTTEPSLPGLPVEPVRRRALTRLVTRKPVRPSAGEVASNPRARSARMRVVERLS